MHHLKVIIDSHIAFIRVFQVDLKPVFAGGGESVDIFQANHSFTWRNCVLRNIFMVYLLIQSRLHIQQKSCGRIRSNKVATKWIDITISSCKSLNIPTNYCILRIQTVFVLFIKSILKKQHAPLPTHLFTKEALQIICSENFWLSIGCNGFCVDYKINAKETTTTPHPQSFVQRKPFKCYVLDEIFAG